MDFCYTCITTTGAFISMFILWNTFAYQNFMFSICFPLVLFAYMNFQCFQAIIVCLGLEKFHPSSHKIQEHDGRLGRRWYYNLMCGNMRKQRYRYKPMCGNRSKEC